MRILTVRIPPCQSPDPLPFSLCRFIRANNCRTPSTAFLLLAATDTVSTEPLAAMGGAMGGGGGAPTFGGGGGGGGGMSSLAPLAGLNEAASNQPARLMTGAQGQLMGGDQRPMTSVKGAGYQSTDRMKKTGFDPLNEGNRGPAPALAKKSDAGPEALAKEMEKQVNKLIEASAEAAFKKDYIKALERAKEAGKKERALCKHREQNGLVDQINLDLTYAVCFNLANAYQKNEMFSEALNTYSLIVKNKQYPQSGRLRVNMGNIYFEQKKYPNAIKMYNSAGSPLEGKMSRKRQVTNTMPSKRLTVEQVMRICFLSQRF